MTGQSQPVPYDYRLYLIAKDLGIPPWELTRPLPPDEDAERVLWLSRIVQYRSLEAQGRNVRRGA